MICLVGCKDACASRLVGNVTSPVSLLPVTLLLYYLAIRDTVIRRVRQQQQANAAATAAGGLQARHEQKTRLGGELKGECKTPTFCC